MMLHSLPYLPQPVTGNMHSSHIQYVNGTVYHPHLFTVQVLAISALGLGCWITAPSHVCQFSNLPTSIHCKYVNNEVDTIHQVKFFHLLLHTICSTPFLLSSLLPKEVGQYQEDIKLLIQFKFNILSSAWAFTGRKPLEIKYFKLSYFRGLPRTIMK